MPIEELNDDSPEFGVVKASAVAGMKNPEDVAWTRLRHPKQRAVSMFVPCYACEGMISITSARQETRVEMKRVGFEMSDKNRMDFYLGQCPRCRRVYWSAPATYKIGEPD